MPLVPTTAAATSTASPCPDRHPPLVPPCLPSVVILGPPNAGKSSLLNKLARRPAAIVSPIPGTTRDLIEVSLDLGGLPVVLCDTAGLRGVTGDAIEVEGMTRAMDRAATAHLRLCVLDVNVRAVGMGAHAAPHPSSPLCKRTPKLRWPRHRLPPKAGC